MPPSTLDPPGDGFDHLADRPVTPKKIKIPDARIGIRVKCITPIQTLRAERARFVLPNGT